MNRRVLLAWLLATSVAWSAEPKAVVTEPATSQLGDLVILDASESEGDSFAWILECSTKTFLPVDGGKRCVFASGTPGKYAFTFIAVGVDEDGKAVLDKTRAVVTIEGPVPPGPTPPDPDPPEPTPPRPVVHGRLYVSYVLPVDPTPSQANLRTSTALRSGLAKLDTAFRAYQADENDLNRLQLADRVKEIGVPVVFVQTRDGTIVETLQEPTVDAILSAVAALRGGR